jgi:hypothetical protein
MKYPKFVWVVFDNEGVPAGVSDDKKDAEHMCMENDTVRKYTLAVKVTTKATPDE